VEDFRTSFTVGPDVFPPRMGETVPAANQSDAPLFEPIRVVFDESLDPATCVLGTTVLVEDVSRDPPVPVEGTLVLRGDGFVLEFHPDPCFGLPPGSTVRVRLAPQVADRKGNAFEGAEFSFATKGTRRPDPALVPPPDGALYATTADAVVAFDLRGAIAADGSFRPGEIRRVDAAGGYDGEFRSTLGRPGHALVDPRSDPATGHSYLYVVDEKTSRVAVVETATGRVGHRYGGFLKPRRLAFEGPAEDPIRLLVEEGAGGRVPWRPLPETPGQPLCGAELAYLDQGGPSDSVLPAAVSDSAAQDATGRLLFLVREDRIEVRDLEDPGAGPFPIPLPGVRSVFSRGPR
jgi:hypothetical protein